MSRSDNDTNRKKKRKLNRDVQNQKHENDTDEDSDIYGEINRNKKNNENENIADSEQGKLYCICRGVDDGTHMVQCQDCAEWFHVRCIPYTTKQIAALEYADQFLCPNDCKGLNAAKKIQQRKDKKKKTKTKTRKKKKRKAEATVKTQEATPPTDTDDISDDEPQKKAVGGKKRRKSKRGECHENMNITLAENDNSSRDIMTCLSDVSQLIDALDDDKTDTTNININSNFNTNTEDDLVTKLTKSLSDKDALIEQLREQINCHEMEMKELKKKQMEDKEMLVRKYEEEIENMSNKNFKLMGLKDGKINELQEAMVENEKIKNKEIMELSIELESGKKEIISLQEQLQEAKQENESKVEKSQDSQKTDRTDITIKSSDSDKTEKSVILTKNVPILSLQSPLSTITTATIQRIPTIIEIDSDSQNSKDNNSFELQENMFHDSDDIDIDMTKEDDDDEDDKHVDDHVNDDNDNEENSEWWQCDACGFENEPSTTVCSICTTQNTQI